MSGYGKIRSSLLKKITKATHNMLNSSQFISRSGADSRWRSMGEFIIIRGVNIPFLHLFPCQSASPVQPDWLQQNQSIPVFLHPCILAWVCWRQSPEPGTTACSSWPTCVDEWIRPPSNDGKNTRNVFQTRIFPFTGTYSTMCFLVTWRETKIMRSVGPQTRELRQLATSVFLPSWPTAWPLIFPSVQFVARSAASVHGFELVG